MDTGPRRLSKRRSLVKQAPMVSMGATITGFLRDCQAFGAKASTIATYTNQLGLWSKWCQKNGIVNIQDVQRTHLMSYLAEMQNKALSTITVRSRALTIRSLLKYADREEYINNERLCGLKLPKAAKPSVYMATLAQIEVLIEAIEQHWKPEVNPHSRFRNETSRTFFCFRDQAILAVQVSVGLRISETFGLLLSDYNQERRELYVKHTKTGTPRAVPVSSALAAYLAAWLNTRPETSPSDFLFITEFGLQLHGPHWTHQFQRYLTFARSPQGGKHKLPRITLSSLRHIPATAMAEENIYHAALLLGHSSTKVTEATYVHRNTRIIRATHEKTDPLAKIVKKRGKGANEKPGF